MQNEQRLRKKIAERQKDWDMLGETLSAFKRERILETRVEEKIRLDQKIKETTVERQHVEQELADLETQLEQLQKAPEEREDSEELEGREEEQESRNQVVPEQPESERQVEKQPKKSFRKMLWVSLGLMIIGGVMLTGWFIVSSKVKASRYVEDLGNGVKLEMVYIPDGTFLMGAPTDEEGSSGYERPQHPVTIAPFYMSKYEVTQAQWEAVARAKPLLYRGANYPVSGISWDDATDFVKRLSQKIGKTYRLPTEAEWEYACRVKTHTAYSFGDDAGKLGNYAWYAENSYGQTHLVGQKKPNDLGLYDIHGNVWEWCQDVWHDNYDGAPTEGRSWEQGGDVVLRLLRGGSYYDPLKDVRCATRFGSKFFNRENSNFGIRLVRDSGQ